ncbi:V-set domain-containing T-cell activation inhibitor 1-like isoform X3 [Simochromis diagramma]|uniref:V-set domain-containing T-cell activation inhibitor 1-like isoform X3 n=1 Tax=Simochromis diagramma TaxID=43689 RepID=UPI001A7F0A85|nr:V-set domain-containing T-cell activation inhibitor 1-like isoform X3 [Simochromis diagramma]
MELLALLFLSFCFLTLSGRTFAAESETPVARVTVREDDDVILPCSLDTNENIESMLFDWVKEVPRKEVFMYRNRSHYNNGLPGQDVEFKGRVSHYPEELKYGNASIRLKQTRLEDKGTYTCIFPEIKPSEKIFRIELVVEGRLKVRNVPGAAPHPSVTNLDQTNDWALLKCDVKGAYPKPTVEWWDSNNQTIPFEEPQVSKKGEHFYITLKTTVKKTGRYRCVATQKEIHHQIYKEINVHLNGAGPKPYVTILKENGLLECEVPGASPKPTVEWWDSDNKTLPSKTVQDEEQQGRFHVIVQTTVTEPGCYRCVATQMEKWHRISSEICVHREKTAQPPSGLPEWAAALIGGFIVVVFVVAVGVVLKIKGYSLKKDLQRMENGPSSELERNLTSEQP